MLFFKVGCKSQTSKKRLFTILQKNNVDGYFATFGHIFIWVNFSFLTFQTNKLDAAAEKPETLALSCSSGRSTHRKSS